jgi:hypothetical protein
LRTGSFARQEQILVEKTSESSPHRPRSCVVSPYQLLVAPGEAGACKDAAAALEYVKGMQTKKRYVQELWES